MAAALIRVAILDDHPVVREGTAALLARQPGLVIAWTAGSLEEASGPLARIPTDVLLLDIRLGNESGLSLLVAGPSGVLARPSGPAVVVLTAYDYPQYAEAALRLGAAAFVLKTAPLPELLDAIERAAAGSPALRGEAESSRSSRVTAREFEVVRLVVGGRSNDEIGAELGIGTKTVETHLHRLFERFELRSRTELAARAVREGWLDVPPA